ncbi:hypothetical protein [Epilithonimonas sp.]|uniref:hypothetical protein n=1 Tax=Epilithonimonas sp. TaxID=2894511 RepID=UPI0035B331B3
MKNLLILFSLVAIAISCKSDNDDEKLSSANAKKVKTIHVIENSNIPNYPIVDRTITFTYDGNSIKNINFIKKGSSSSSDIIFYYVNSRLDRVNFSSNSNSYLKLNYTNDKVTSINYYKIPGYNTDALYKLSYNGNQINKIEYSGTNRNFVFNISYNGENVNSINNNALSYDSKNNAFAGIDLVQQLILALISGDETGEFNTFSYYHYGTVFGKNNVLGYKNYGINFMVSNIYEGDFIKKINLTYLKQNGYTTETSFEYTYE